jgi:dolichyl-phosphate-mannose-protein mannosyltransferase
MNRSAVYAASAVSFALGLFFIFVWTPLPWGWKGIDGYDQIAVGLARGEPFPTIHIVWGYAYFLAIFYRLFGNHPAIPLTVQAALNACIPLMLYRLVKLEMNERVAIVAAVLTGFFSFNTVYVSTQASDPVCTVLVVAAVLCFAIADRRQQTTWFVGAGLLAAAAYQFRPNLVLFPFFMAALYVVVRARTAAGLKQMAVFLVVFVIGAAPWVIRNYRWTGGLFVPASTHGGVQLWFGTLQTGPYRESWLYNPRAAFEFPPVDYTSLDELPIVVTAIAPNCDLATRRQIDLVYWTNREPTPRRLTVTPNADGSLLATLPAQPAPTAVFFYFDVASGTDDRVAHATTPPAGAADPAMIVVSRDHLGDLDIDGKALDVFDVVRMLRHLAWREPLADIDRLDLDGDGRLTEADVRRAAALLVDERADLSTVADPTTGVALDGHAATIRFRDGSSLTVPRRWNGTITDLQLTTPVVPSSSALFVQHSRSFASIPSGGHRPAPGRPAPACTTLDRVAANRVPYRRLPHELRRFTALALDNIRRDPGGYLAASALRALRVFIVTGSEDQRTAYQFSGAGRVYAIGRAVSVALLAAFAAGVWIARARRMRLFMLLAPILYVPLTICFMLINARYSMTIQPFVFAFVAVTLVAVRDRVRGAPPG